MHKEGDKLIIEPAAPQSLLALLATLQPIRERLPDIADSAPDDVSL